MRINPEDLLKQLEEKGVVPRCPVCGEGEFTVPVSELGTNVVALSAVMGTDVVPNRALPVVAFICQNCAFVRLHLLSFEQLPDAGEAGPAEGPPADPGAGA